MFTIEPDRGLEEVRNIIRLAILCLRQNEKWESIDRPRWWRKKKEIHANLIAPLWKDMNGNRDQGRSPN